MNILHTVEFYNPSVGGAQEVVKQISEQLVRRGHSVTVATKRLPERKSNDLNGVTIEGFDISGNSVRGFQGNAKRYQEFLIESKFDLMMNYAAQQWATDLVFPIIDKISYRKIMIPCGFSALYNPTYAGYFASLPVILSQYDHLIFHASKYRDIDFARQHNLNCFSIVPNGALQAEFDQVNLAFRQRYNIPKGVPMLLTVGSHTGLKGHRLAIEAFLRARIGEAVLVIIGNVITRRGCLSDCKRRAFWTNLISGGKKKVLLLDPPRQDVVAAYHASDLFVFGSNIEYSPLVLFEAMASKTAFITTACGNAEEIASNSGGGIVVPSFQTRYGKVDASPSKMAKTIETLVQNPEQRKRLAESGYQAWRDHFTWEKIAGEYERVYQKVLEGFDSGVEV